MICLLTFFFCGILGIFSAKYRRFAIEAFHCVARRATLRPCESGFNRKMKSKITSKLLDVSPRLGRVVYQHFEIISWIFTILFIGSLVYAGYILVDLLIFHSCPGFPWDLNPFGGSNESTDNGSCPISFIGSLGVLMFLFLSE